MRAISSVGQSYRLITGWSGVRVPDGPPAATPLPQTELAAYEKQTNVSGAGFGLLTREYAPDDARRHADIVRRLPPRQIFYRTENCGFPE